VRYDIQYHSLNYHYDFTGRERLRELIDPHTRSGEADNFWTAGRSVAWDPNQGRSLVRAAYGRFYQYISGGSLRNEADTLKQNSISITNPSYPDPYGGLSPQAFLTANARPNVSILDDKIRNGYGDTVTMGVVAATVVGAWRSTSMASTRTCGISRGRSEHQSAGAGVRLQTLTAAQAATITSFTNAQLDARRPLVDVGQHHAADVERLAQLPRALCAPRQALRRQLPVHRVVYARVDEEQRREHLGLPPSRAAGGAERPEAHLVASGSARLPYEITVGAVWTIRTALPFDATSGVDLTGDGVAGPGARPPRRTWLGATRRGRRSCLVSSTRGGRSRT
jgi:hypothetical protein